MLLLLKLLLSILSSTGSQSQRGACRQMQVCSRDQPSRGLADQMRYEQRAGSRSTAAITSCTSPLFTHIKGYPRGYPHNDLFPGNKSLLGWS